MISLLNPLLVLVFLLNLFVLGTSRIRALIQAAALQGVVLGVMPLVASPLAASPLAAHGHLKPMTALVGIVTILVKGSLIPQMLFKALRDAQIKREVEPIIGFMPSMLLGAL